MAHNHEVAGSSPAPATIPSMYDVVTDPSVVIEDGKEVFAVETIHEIGSLIVRQEFHFSDRRSASRFVALGGREPYRAHLIRRVAAKAPRGG